MWDKVIPRRNWVFMIISLTLVFGLDFLILIFNWGLRGYWFLMLAVLAAFALFYLVENHWLKKRFAGSTSRLDPWISAAILMRNIIFVLNFIPGIQVLGYLFLVNFFVLAPAWLLDLTRELGRPTFNGGVGLVAPILLLLYVILIVARFRTTAAATPTYPS